MLPANHPLATRQKLSVTALTDQSFLLMHPYTSIYQLCMQIFQNAGIHPSILRTARVESLISAVAVGEGISLFAESNFRLFQHEGVISVPLEESPVLRIGFAYKKPENILRPWIVFYILWQIHRNIEWFSASTTDVKP